MQGVDQRPSHEDSGFRHQAMFYAGDDEFGSAAAEFISEGLDAHEPTFVVVDARKIDRLSASLGADADRVVFADMARVGRNPARILPAWQQFVDDHPADRLRGIGEPIWPGRGPAELVECRLHEALLNMAFDGGPPLTLLCPYDTDGLDPDVIDGARHTHPVVGPYGDGQPSDAYAGQREAASIITESLPAPPARAAELRFSVGPLDHFRRFVHAEATVAGLAGASVDDLVLAANEIASNSLLHGGGTGSARVWSQGGSVICEIRDAGRIDDLFIGRIRPMSGATAGRGVWMANQLCDLVQLRSSDTGTVVRLHMHVEAQGVGAPVPR